MEAIPNGTKRKGPDTIPEDDSFTESKRARFQDEAPSADIDQELEAQSEQEVDEAWNSSTATRQPQRRNHSKAGGYTNETTGQRSFFPGVDADSDDDDELDETTNDALLYLRSVR